MPHLNERQLRLAAALEARSLGYGGVSAVARATGMARGTIHRALEELQHPQATSAREQVRARGGGRRRIVAENPQILKRLKELLESSTRGDPMSPLLWTCQSTRQLAEALSQSDQWRYRRPVVGGDGLQSASQPEDVGGRRQPSRSRPAVSVPQPPGAAIPEAG